jgi:hypothetical protein
MSAKASTLQVVTRSHHRTWYASVVFAVVLAAVAIALIFTRPASSPAGSGAQTSTSHTVPAGPPVPGAGDLRFKPLP